MKRIRKNLLALSVGLVAAFLLAEMILRIIPLPITDFNTTFAYRAHDELGYLPTPSQHAAYNCACVRNPSVSTNNLGFRGAEWDTTRHPRIALLGDSYLLGLTVPDEALLATRLRFLTGGEVMNTGVSGFGTFHELITWRTMVKPQNPDVVVIFVFLRNDIRDNHCGLTSPNGKRFSPCCDWKEGKFVEQRQFDLPPGSGSGWKAWIKSNCRTCKALSNLGRKPRTERPEGVDPFATPSMAYNVFRREAGPQWDEAWSITQELLRQLRDETAASGIPLLVVTIPDPINLSPNWKSEIKAELGISDLPADFDPDFPRKRFQLIADSLQLHVLHTEEVLRAYRDQWSLPEPEFGYRCDGHWNPVGQRVVADTLFNRLKADGMMPVGGQPFQPWLQPSPQSLLGDVLFRQIYEEGEVSY